MLMVFQIIPIRPNPRKQYHDQVEELCRLLKDSDGMRYRRGIFLLLGISAKQVLKTFQRTGTSKFRETTQAKLFLRNHPADIKALEIMDELDTIYAAPPDKIDNLRGAVAEVFSFFICRKVYVEANIEVQVQIDTWTSNSIDVAGCNYKGGHCLQSKCSASAPGAVDSILIQKCDLDQIEELTAGKAVGAYITFVEQDGFFAHLRSKGINTDTYTVFGRTDLAVLEQRLSLIQS